MLISKKRKNFMIKKTITLHGENTKNESINIIVRKMLNYMLCIFSSTLKEKPFCVLRTLLFYSCYLI